MSPADFAPQTPHTGFLSPTSYEDTRHAPGSLVARIIRRPNAARGAFRKLFHTIAPGGSRFFGAAFQSALPKEPKNSANNPPKTFTF